MSLIFVSNTQFLYLAFKDLGFDLGSDVLIFFVNS